MKKDFRDWLMEFQQVEMLNDKGKNELIKNLKMEIQKLHQDIITLETKVQYK